MRHSTSRGWRFRILFILLFGIPSAWGATKVWNGSVNTNWAAGRNWTGNTVPQNGDTLVFPVGAANRNTWNQLTATFEEVRFEGDYTVGGSPIKTRRLFALLPMTLQTGAQFQPDAVVAGSHGLHIHGNVTLAGDTTVGGAEGVFFIGSVSGPGRLICAAGISLQQTNGFAGGTIIRTNAVLSLLGLGTLGSPTAPVEIQEGGQLDLAASTGNPIRLAGFGPRNQGAISQRNQAARININSPLEFSGPASVRNLGTLRIAGATSASNATAARLVKVGTGLLMARNETNLFDVPVEITEGSFFLTEFPQTMSGRRVTTPFHNFGRELIVGRTNRIGNVFADLYYSKNVNNTGYNPNQTFAPDVPVTVHANGRLMLGPRQDGLGSPLRLFGGEVELVKWNDVALYNPVGTHWGEIVVEGPQPSSINGQLYLYGEVVVRSQSQARLTFGPPTLPGPNGLYGDTLRVEGARVTLTNNAPRFPWFVGMLTNLVVTSGEAFLASPGSPPLHSIVGSGGQNGPGAVLRAGPNPQFPPEATIEVIEGGALVSTRATPVSVASLSFHGGGGDIGPWTVDNLSTSAGGQLVLQAVAPPTATIRVLKSWASQGTPAASVGFRFGVPTSSQPLVLIQNDTLQPIPDEFPGLPDNGVISHDGRFFRINYTGGDGNDLVLEPQTAPPAVKLTLTHTTPDNATISWPASAAACRLEYQPELDSAGGWIPVTVAPHPDGSFSFDIGGASDSPGGFFRLNCP